MIAGVVYDPLNRELFAAERGAGARLNGAPIHVSKAPKLEDALLSTGFPSRSVTERQHSLLLSARDADARHPARRLGGHRLGLYGLRPPRRLLGIWTESLGYGGRHAAGRRSRRQSLRHAGEPLDLHGRYLLADNGLIHAETLTLFSKRSFTAATGTKCPLYPLEEWELQRG